MMKGIVRDPSSYTMFTRVTRRSFFSTIAPVIELYEGLKMKGITTAITATANEMYAGMGEIFL